MMSCSVKYAELATFPQLVFPRKLSQNLLSCQRSWTECGFSDDLYHLGYNRGVKHLNCLSSNGVSKLKFSMLLINCDVESSCYVLDNSVVFVQTLLMRLVGGTAKIHAHFQAMYPSGWLVNLLCFI